MTKQVIVMRHDLHMRMGKAVAQGAHAAMMFLIACPQQQGLTEAELVWFREGIPKIVVRVESEEELKAIIVQAKSRGVKCYPIADAGRTEFHGVPTLTCCAIGPDYEERIDTITGNLKLL